MYTLYMVCSLILVVFSVSICDTFFNVSLIIVFNCGCSYYTFALMLVLHLLCPTPVRLKKLILI